MKDFIKFTFASAIGFFIALGFLFILFLFVVFGVVSSLDSGNKIVVKPQSVLEIKLDHPVQERTPQNPFEQLSFGDMAPVGLNDILRSIKTAKNDSRIKGILLNLSIVQTGYATLEEIRSALMDFKKGGKFVVAYGEMYSQQAYYLASCADKIFLNPQGVMDLTGLRAQVAFYKGALEKLELEPVIIRHGTFKSAVEPYMLEQMSDSNRKQVSAYLNSIWNHVLGNMAKDRKQDPSSLKAIADSLLIRNANDAVKYKAVDKLVYNDELLALLRKDYLGMKEDEKINFISLKKYRKTLEGEESSSKDKIALVYAAGEISGGKGDD
jgi:protease-4